MLFFEIRDRYLYKILVRLLNYVGTFLSFGIIKYNNMILKKL